MRTTVAGDRLGATAVEVMRDLDRAGAELRAASGTISGPLRIGLMPTFTRGLLAPALQQFLSNHPEVQISVTEAFSAELVVVRCWRGKWILRLSHGKRSVKGYGCAPWAKTPRSSCSDRADLSRI